MFMVELFVPLSNEAQYLSFKYRRGSYCRGYRQYVFLMNKASFLRAAILIYVFIRRYITSFSKDSEGLYEKTISNTPFCGGLSSMSRLGSTDSSPSHCPSLQSFTSSVEPAISASLTLSTESTIAPIPQSTPFE